MKKEEKRVVIDEIKAKLQEAEKATLLFLDFGRVKANRIAGLRKEFKASNIYYRVTKADLLRIAFKELGYEADPKLFRGSVALASFAGDATEIAKKFSEIKDEDANPVFVFKGGFVEGKWYSTEQVLSLSKLPPKSVLVGSLVYMVSSPISRLVTVLSKPERDLVMLLNQIKDKKQPQAA